MLAHACKQAGRRMKVHCRLCTQCHVPEDSGALFVKLPRGVTPPPRAITTLEYEFSTALDFGGIATSEAESAIKRASKAGLCSSGELVGAVSLFTGAENLKRQVGSRG